MSESKLVIAKPVVEESFEVKYEAASDIAKWLEGTFVRMLKWDDGDEKVFLFQFRNGEQLSAVEGDILVRSRTGGILIMTRAEFDARYEYWTPPVEEPKEPPKPVIDHLGNDLTNLRIGDSIRRNGGYGLHDLDI